MNNNLQRRSFLKLSLGSLAASASLAKAAELCLGATPPQTEGPFYPVKDQADKDWDLVNVTSHTQSALGEIIIIQGQVVDNNCEPVAEALVEIWQACASGKYNHPNDPNTAPLDPHFQYWGRAVTDSAGRYMFRTIKPGAYPAASDWWRPPHVHYKVHKRGYLELTTQLYFEGEAYNADDKILQRLSKSDQEKVVCPLKISDKGEKIVTFNISIEKA
ncbi:MAG: dioxygenase family protein [Pseudobdellovibrionaceae bacterium]